MLVPEAHRGVWENGSAIWPLSMGLAPFNSSQVEYVRGYVIGLIISSGPRSSSTHYCPHAIAKDSVLLTIKHTVPRSPYVHIPDPYSNKRTIPSRISHCRCCLINNNNQMSAMLVRASREKDKAWSWHTTSNHTKSVVRVRTHTTR